MYEELQVGLEGIITPERMDVILEAYRQLTDAGIDTINDELVGIYNMQDGIADNAMLVSRVEDCLMVGLIEALRRYGVTVQIDTATMISLTGILQTLVGFEHYLIPETLWDFVNQGQDADHILASLVTLFSDIEPDDVINTVDTVNPEVIERMRVIAERRMMYDAEPAEVSPDHTLRIGTINRLLRSYNQKHPALVVELAQSGFPSGQDLTIVFEQVFEQLDNLPPQELGPEFLGLVYYSNTPLKDVYETARALPQDFTDSQVEQRRIEHALDQAYAYVEGAAP